jgi:hypothetical protein
VKVEDTGKIEAANKAFYRALESGSLEMMDEIWEHGDGVRCVHPGWEMITGWTRVRDSWTKILENGQKMRVSPTDVWVRMVGDIAFVTCTENITVFDETSFDTAQAVATNLFVRIDDRWLMIHHHASPVPMLVPDTSSDTIQ